LIHFSEQAFCAVQRVAQLFVSAGVLLIELFVAARSCFDKRDEAKRKLCNNEVLGSEWNPSKDPVKCKLSGKNERMAAEVSGESWS